MVSFRATLLALASAAIVAADYYIDPTSVDLLTRRAWCSDELSNCPIICQQTSPGTVLANTCDPETLTYGCVCSNGLQPNMSEFSLTLPFHVCQQWVIQCRNDCGINNACAASCAEDHPCGAQEPKRVNTTTSSTMPATGTAGSTGPTVFNGLGEGATSSPKPAGNAAAPALLQFGSAYGLVVVAAGMIGGFAVML
ncbi:hypothetical protein B0T16DRAFT_425674 [Cercophora newfieldiana]|uniref:DUF7707 domain-containing protein n=1 Tax=Cercophora newfieldiana TaxID=92897 RepID=A0AA39YU16_9PEZI|nr:hypothetical protein B0T16DRAFT_425674 [Cercophora newfieldiana]